MSRKDLIKTIQRFAEECDKFSKALNGEVLDGNCIRQSKEAKLARAQILEAHRDWANNLLLKL